MDTNPIISIHAPQARGDRLDIIAFAIDADFNPRPASAGRREIWRTTAPTGHFNPRPASAGRPAGNAKNQKLRVISIHAPQARGDPIFAE